MSKEATQPANNDEQVSRILGWIERRGNQLPDPVFLFFWLILFLVVVSIFASLAGVSAAHPTEMDPRTGSQRVIFATSLLSAENIARLWIEMPKTFTHFHPLGYVLVVMLGTVVLMEKIGCIWGISCTQSLDKNFGKTIPGKKRSALPAVSVKDANQVAVRDAT